MVRGPQTVAQLWETPALVLSDAGAHPVTSSREIGAFFAAAADQYSALGVVETRPDIQEEHWLSARLVSVTVRWSNLNVEGEEVAHEYATYVLRVDENGALKIRTAVIGEEMTH